ncbi:MAG: ferredoxin [Chitinophagales bacterium]|nr:ferredoxin [Chitinophagales bacterium]
MYKVIQYRSKCIGCNACVEAAPKRWIVSKKDGRAILVGAAAKKGIYMVDVEDWEYEENNTAKQHCPVGIIDVRKLF